MRFVSILMSCVATVYAGPVFAQLTKVDNQDEFLRLIAGKTLTRPFIKIMVSEDGSIKGTGARWNITGDWTWIDGHFCRDLEWGGEPLGYNCQEVKAGGGRVRFTSDRGAGDSAGFKISVD